MRALPVALALSATLALSPAAHASDSEPNACIDSIAGTADCAAGLAGALSPATSSAGLALNGPVATAHTSSLWLFALLLTLAYSI